MLGCQCESNRIILVELLATRGPNPLGLKRARSMAEATVSHQFSPSFKRDHYCQSLKRF